MDALQFLHHGETNYIEAAYPPTERAANEARRRTKHVFYWMAHASNLAKGSLPNDRSLCPFCNASETQHHINVSCTHPPVVEMRKMMQREIMIFFQKYRHHHLPQQHRWIIQIVDYIEENLWADSIEGGYLE